MELIALNEHWTGSETKLDLHGIYRRPGPGVNTTGALPLRRHQQWRAKGFEFVALASVEDVNLVVGDLRAKGVNLPALQQCYPPRLGGKFDVDAYVRYASGELEQKDARLREMVAKHGPSAVREILAEQQQVIPAWLAEMAEPEPVSKGAAKK